MAAQPAVRWHQAQDLQVGAASFPFVVATSPRSVRPHLNCRPPCMEQRLPAPLSIMFPFRCMTSMSYLSMFIGLALLFSTRESIDPILWIKQPNTPHSFDLVAEHIYGLESQNDSGLLVVAAALHVRARALRLGRFGQGLNKVLESYLVFGPP